MEQAIDIFDRVQHRRNRDRASANLAAHDFLFREIGERLADRLGDVQRQFHQALIVGARAPLPDNLIGQGRQVGQAVQVDLSAACLAQTGIVADEEYLPFAPQSFDLILAPLTLHWVNDLPGALIQLRQALKPDGLLLAAMFGGGTLAELRDSMMTAELEVEGGVSPRVSPFAELRDAGALLQRAGLALPVADMDTITVTYENPLRLLADLRGMGEQNVVRQRRRTCLRRETLMRAMTIYQQKYAGPDGRVPATFEVTYLTGWAPHESQQQPLRPGTARSRLADALGSIEIGTGDKAER